VKIQHGALALDVPKGWTDESTLLFVAPPTALPTVHDAVRAGGSLLVTFRRAEGKAPLDEAKAILDENLAGLKQHDAQLVELERGTLATGIGEGATSLHRITLANAPIRQLELVVVVGRTAVCAVASCGEDEWSAKGAELRAALASLSIGAVT
jgi:hypothetical protein